MTRRLPFPSRLVLLAALAALVAGACSGDQARRATPPPTEPPPPTAGAAATPAAMPTPVVTPASATTPAPTSTAHPVPSALVVGSPAPRPVGLVRSDGQPWALTDHAGHPTIVFFGYTHCPDVCPETIATLLEVARARPEVRVAFITVDPERDTPEFLAQWVHFLPEGVVGVTGTPAAIRGAADLYGVQYARVDAGSAAGYSMAHTAFQYLIDAEGDLVAVHPFATPAAAIISDLASLAPAASASPATAALRVDAAWVRTSPMMALAGAAFMVLVNDGPTDDALVAVTSPVAVSAELHRTAADAGGVMSMMPVAAIPIPAGGSTELAPGGYHVMLIGLREPLAAGSMVPLALTFESGHVLEVAATVSDVAPGTSITPMTSPMPGVSPMPGS
ncbi:MAG: copper chaperone PCu(A)C [Chloroflexi bacterium]|nr:copper chaperone PCu(A)C [Chloroflexota bacterium]